MEVEGIFSKAGRGGEDVEEGGWQEVAILAVSWERRGFRCGICVERRVRGRVCGKFVVVVKVRDVGGARRVWRRRGRIVVCAAGFSGVIGGREERGVERDQWP